MSKNTPLKALSVFSGAGGMDLGLEAAGFQVQSCIEKADYACETLRENCLGGYIFGPPDSSGDIREVKGTAILDAIGASPGDLDLIVGGPPCQPFSQAASQRFLQGDSRYKRKGFDDKGRGNLLWDFLRLLEELEPRAFLIENVPGLMKIDNGVQLRTAIETLEKLGYTVAQPKILDAMNFGVPQTRKRLFLWGARGLKKVDFPEATHADVGDLFLKPYRRVVHALVGMDKCLPNHVTRNHAESSIERYRSLSVGQREKLGRVDRLDPLQPSKTVIAGGMNGGGRSHLHPFIARTLTVRECARLQTFPDDYIFQGSIARQFTQVGNAVPPLLAEVLGRHIFYRLTSRKPESPFKHGQYLVHSENDNVLNQRLFQESVVQKEEWIYIDELERLNLVTAAS